MLKTDPTLKPKADSIQQKVTEIEASLKVKLDESETWSDDDIKRYPANAQMTKFFVTKDCGSNDPVKIKESMVDSLVVVLDTIPGKEGEEDVVVSTETIYSTPDLQNGLCKRVYPDGKIFIYTLKNGQIEGPAKTIEVDGTIFTAEYKNGAFTGPSKQLNAHYEVVGTTESGRLTGYIEIRYKIENVESPVTLKGNTDERGMITGHGTGDFVNYSFEGEFKDSTPVSGKTLLSKENNIFYEGEVSSRGTPFGNGTLTTTDTVYKGTYNDLGLQGSGSYKKLLSEETYKGEFKNGVVHGTGHLKLPEQKIEYQGAFEDGHYHGEGSLTHDLNVYKGEFRNGQITGIGQLTQGDGSILTGTFNEGWVTGEGSLLFLNGTLYTGGFKNSQLFGKGTINYPDGNSFVGSFENGRRQGFGTMYDSGSKIMTEGVYKDDVLEGSEPVKLQEGDNVEIGGKSRFGDADVDGLGQFGSGGTGYDANGKRIEFRGWNGTGLGGFGNKKNVSGNFANSLENKFDWTKIMKNRGFKRASGLVGLAFGAKLWYNNNSKSNSSL